MKNPVSIFILDVKNSTQFENPDELTEYLGRVVDRAMDWCGNIVYSTATSRAGDEILFVAEDFATAYLVATYIDAFWKYPKHPPCFGVGCGFIEKDIRTIANVDAWNHPVMKQVSNALQKSKESGRRMVLALFQQHREIDVLTLDTLLEAEEALLQNQTAHQRLACTLLSLWPKQKDVALLLQKTEATVSNQLKNGRCESLASIADAIIGNLIYLQSPDKDYNLFQRAKILQVSIRDELIRNHMLPDIIEWRTARKG